MKLSKSLFLAFAGLGLFACSNEDVVENGVQDQQGNATVSIKLNLPKIITDGSRSGDGIPATGETVGTTGDQTPVVITSGIIVLNSARADQPSQTLQFTGEDLKTSEPITFTNVITPRSVEVYINGGVETTGMKEGNLSIEQINTAGLAAPLYAEVTTSDVDASDGNGFVWNEELKQYDVTVTPAPRYARLEFSGISHNTNHSTNLCIFKEANFKGIFLNNVATTEKGGINASADNWNELSTAAYEAPTWSAAAGEDNSFVSPGKVWPEAGQCYAYSIFEGTMPSLVFCVDGVTLNDNWNITGWQEGNYLYASVAKYVTSTSIEEADREKYGVAADGKTIETFKAGNIYQISNISIPDDAWGPTPEGSTPVKVVATVKVLPWNIVDGTVDWN